MVENLVTKVEIVPIIPRDGHVAFANVVFEDRLALNGIGIHTCLSRSGFRLLYPSKQLPSGIVVQIFHPVTREISDVIQEAVVGQYQRLMENVTRI